MVDYINKDWLEKASTADPKVLMKEQQVLLNKPFFFEGTNGRAVLLVHGWTSTSYEVRRLGEFLHLKGYTVYGPLLSGHGTSHTDLVGKTAQGWIDDVKEAHTKLKKNHQQVFVGGTSIGGSLAMILAQEGFDVSGLILMATPYEFRFERFSYWATKLASKFKKYNRKFYPPTFGSRTTVTRLISYQKYPYDSVFEAYKLIQKSRDDLEKVVVPCFILQSSHDHIIRDYSIDKIYSGISSKIKKKKLVDKTYQQ